MSAPILSICIPTHNRARYLRALLDRLSRDLSELPFDCEILVGDNASTDDTPDVVAGAGDALPLRSFRHAENVGAASNLWSLFREAKGRYVVYLADDDILLPEELANAIALLEANPDASALYAPWSFVDLHAGTTAGQFYHQPETVTIKRQNYAMLMAHVLNHGVFSEISIVRRDKLPRLGLKVSPLAFWAFTIPCELLDQGDVIYAAQPFYGSVTRHFAGDNRTQAGNVEVQDGWDMYRGGLEYMLGLALQQGGLGSPEQARRALDRLIVSRMQVALRLRVAAGRDPVENYFLGARLRGLGAETGCAVSFDQLRAAAAIHHLTVELPPLYGASRVALLGRVHDEALAMFRKNAAVEVAVISDASAVTPDDIVLELGGDPGMAPSVAAGQARAAFHEADLMRKFA